MCSARFPGSLRVAYDVPREQKREPVSTSKVIAAACLMAASPLAIAAAQEAPKDQATPLPALQVETNAKQKKAATKPKKKPSTATVSPTPQGPQPQAAPPPSTADGALTPGGNPYANPNAPYMVEKSASGKFTEPLVNTPKTITALPKEVLQDKQVKDLRDLARDVPGLTIGSAEGGNSYGAFAIRGFKASNDIFMDGIRNPGNVIPDVFAVEQVEIYKGPSGGIAGRSTIGGAVNLVTKAPDLNFNNFEIATTVGTDETFRSTLDVNQVITRDFAVRANVMYDQHDVAGRDITESERWGGLIAATAKVSDDVKVTLDYYRYRNDAIPDWGVPIGWNDGPVPKPSDFHVPVTELGTPRDTWVGMKGLDFFNEQADIVTGTVVAKLADNITLTNKTRGGQSRVAYVATSMEGLNDVHHPNRDQMAQIFANQTELNVKFTTGTFKHDVVAGVEVTRETIDRDAFTVSNLYDTARPFPPNPYTQIDTITNKAKLYDASIDTIGTYLMDTVHLSDQWIVNGGIRFDDFTRDQVGGPGTATDPKVAATNIAANTAKVQDDLFSWNVGVVYKPIPIASVYAAYAVAESPVGSELDSTGAQYNGISATLVDVPPQEARAIEIGTKWELFDKRLLATAALFQTDVDHARTNDGVTPGNPQNAFAGEYRVRGIELSASGNITKQLSVFGGLVLLDTEVLASSNPQDIGRRLANIPLTQFSLMSRYKVTDDLAVGGTATYGGEIYGGHLAANAANNHTVDWWRFDAFAEYDLTKNIEIELSGLNLTNELYYDALYQSTSSFAFVAPGRAGYMTVKYKY